MKAKRDYFPLPDEPYDELPDFDMPTPEERTAANALFPAYVFYENRKDGRDFRTSCCGRAEFRPSVLRTMTEADALVSYGRHNDEVCCPFCGASAVLKDVKKLGKRKKLDLYLPVVFLKERDGALYALAYWMNKNYRGDLEAPPDFMLTSAYRFSPGRASMRQFGYCNTKLEEYAVEGNYNPNHRVITEPFAKGSFMWKEYVKYPVIGMKAIENSAFKYCGYESWSGQGGLHGDLMKYLAASCIYPRNIEMLVKFGPRELVDELVKGRKKNADLIKWGEPDPCRAFGLNKQELREFMSGSQDLDVLRVYKAAKKKKMRLTMGEAENIEHCLREDAVPFVKLCGKYRLQLMTTLRYLDKHTGQRCYGGYFTVGNAYTLWRDYLNAAEFIGYDLRGEVVLKPKHLDAAHNAAAAEQNRRLTATNQPEMTAAQKTSLTARAKKYNFDLGELSIFIAPSAEEVITEGRVLKHCVGGYADRHMKGSTTILFLRRSDDLHTPLLTVEMDGGSIQQIHGYRNEIENGKRIAPDPRKAYKDFLDPWLAWMHAGSKRDENGAPVLPKPKKKKVRKAA